MGFNSAFKGLINRRRVWRIFVRLFVQVTKPDDMDDITSTLYGRFIIIKQTRCTNFSNLFLEWKSTCFGQFLCPSSGVFHRTHSSGIC